MSISSEKHSLHSNGEFSSPSKRSRPSLSQRLGLPDESDQSDDEPYSPSDEQQFPSSTEQKIIRQPQASLRESTLISTGQPSKAILDLLQDDDEDEEEDEEEAYSPSQLDPATMDEVSDQLKGMKKCSTPTASVPPVLSSYIPPVPSSSNVSQDDWDYRDREKKKSNEVLLTTCPCRSIPLHGESTTIVDPRLRIHSARLRAKVRQLILDRLPSDCLDRNEILEELDHLVESPGRRLYWYRVICFLQNISNANNSSKQVHSLLKELSRLLVLTPTLSKILKIKQKYPKAIPIESTSTMNKDPRQEISHRAKSVLHLKLLRYH